MLLLNALEIKDSCDTVCHDRPSGHLRRFWRERIIVVHNDEVNSKDSEAFFWEAGIWVELHRVPGGLKRVPERLLRAPLKHQATQ